jgi:hypothetical protein
METKVDKHGIVILPPRCDLERALDERIEREKAEGFVFDPMVREMNMAEMREHPVIGWKGRD